MARNRKSNIGNASFDGVRGVIYACSSERNLWWAIDADRDTPQILFSLRGDGVWRMVGAPANGTGLRFY